MKIIQVETNSVDNITSVLDENLTLKTINNIEDIEFDLTTGNMTFIDVNGEILTTLSVNIPIHLTERIYNGVTYTNSEDIEVTIPTVIEVVESDIQTKCREIFNDIPNHPINMDALYLSLLDEDNSVYDVAKFVYSANDDIWINIANSPIATEEITGVTKLYASVESDNTDGTVTQAAIKTAIEEIYFKIDNLELGGIRTVELSYNSDSATMVDSTASVLKTAYEYYEKGYFIVASISYLSTIDDELITSKVISVPCSFFDSTVEEEINRYVSIALPVDADNNVRVYNSTLFNSATEDDGVVSFSQSHSALSVYEGVDQVINAPQATYDGDNKDTDYVNVDYITSVRAELSDVVNAPQAEYGKDGDDTDYINRSYIESATNDLTEYIDEVNSDLDDLKSDVDQVVNAPQANYNTSSNNDDYVNTLFLHNAIEDTSEEIKASITDTSTISLDVTLSNDKLTGNVYSEDLKRVCENYTSTINNKSILSISGDKTASIESDTNLTYTSYSGYKFEDIEEGDVDLFNLPRKTVSRTEFDLSTATADYYNIYGGCECGSVLESYVPSGVPITTSEELYTYINGSTSCYLANNILVDISEFTVTSRNYSGTFDGNGYSIVFYSDGDITVDTVNTFRSSFLFHQITTTGSVKNLTVIYTTTSDEDVTYTLSTTTTNSNICIFGGVVAHNYGAIRNVNVLIDDKVTIISTGNSNKGASAGGIVGNNYGSNGYVKNSTIEIKGSLQVLNSIYEEIGGVAGRCNGGTIISTVIKLSEDSIRSSILYAGAMCAWTGGSSSPTIGYIIVDVDPNFCITAADKGLFFGYVDLDISVTGTISFLQENNIAHIASDMSASSTSILRNMTKYNIYEKSAPSIHCYQSDNNIFVEVEDSSNPFSRFSVYREEFITSQLILNIVDHTNNNINTSRFNGTLIPGMYGGNFILSEIIMGSLSWDLTAPYITVSAKEYTLDTIQPETFESLITSDVVVESGVTGESIDVTTAELISLLESNSELTTSYTNESGSYSSTEVPKTPGVYTAISGIFTNGMLMCSPKTYKITITGSSNPRKTTFIGDYDLSNDVNLIDVYGSVESGTVFYNYSIPEYRKSQEISNANELYEYLQQGYGNAHLTNSISIDLTNTDIIAYLSTYRVISASSILDGAGYTVSFNGSTSTTLFNGTNSYDNTSFFINDCYGTIQNINIEYNNSFNYQSYVASGESVSFGLLAGRLYNNAKIYNVHVETAEETIIASSNTSSLNASSGSNAQNARLVGGIAGSSDGAVIRNSSVVINGNLWSYQYGGDGASTAIGGLLGYALNTEVSNCSIEVTYSGSFLNTTAADISVNNGAIIAADGGYNALSDIIIDVANDFYSSVNGNGKYQYVGLLTSGYSYTTAKTLSSSLTPTTTSEFSGKLVLLNELSLLESSNTLSGTVDYIFGNGNYYGLLDTPTDIILLYSYSKPNITVISGDSKTYSITTSSDFFTEYNISINTSNHTDCVLYRVLENPSYTTIYENIIPGLYCDRLNVRDIIMYNESNIDKTITCYSIDMKDSEIVFNAYHDLSVKFTDLFDNADFCELMDYHCNIVTNYTATSTSGNAYDSQFPATAVGSYAAYINIYNNDLSVGSSTLPLSVINKFVKYTVDIPDIGVYGTNEISYRKLMNGTGLSTYVLNEVDSPLSVARSLDQLINAPQATYDGDNQDTDYINVKYVEDLKEDLSYTYQTIEDSNLEPSDTVVDSINYNYERIGEIRTELGTVALNTDSNEIRAAINELDSEISTLSTSTSTSLTALTSRVSTNETDIMNIGASIGDTDLPTIDQTLTGALHEVADKTEENANDIILNTNAISSINSTIGSTTLTTTSQTLTGAITEVNTLVSALTDEVNNITLFVFVSELPTEDIDSGVIYIVPKNEVDEEENNVYEEWLFIPETSEWELFGTLSTKVDLSGYYTKTEIDVLLTTLDTSIKTYTGSIIRSVSDANALGFEMPCTTLAFLQKAYDLGITNTTFLLSGVPSTTIFTDAPITANTAVITIQMLTSTRLLGFMQGINEGSVYNLSVTTYGGIPNAASWGQLAKVSDVPTLSNEYSIDSVNGYTRDYVNEIEYKENYIDNSNFAINTTGVTEWELGENYSKEIWGGWRIGGYNNSSYSITHLPGVGVSINMGENTGSEYYNLDRYGVRLPSTGRYTLVVRCENSSEINQTYGYYRDIDTNTNLGVITQSNFTRGDGYTQEFFEIEEVENSACAFGVQTVRASNSSVLIYSMSLYKCDYAPPYQAPNYEAELAKTKPTLATSLPASLSEASETEAMSPYMAWELGEQNFGGRTYSRLWTSLTSLNSSFDYTTEFTTIGSALGDNELLIYSYSTTPSDLYPSYGGIITMYRRYNSRIEIRCTNSNISTNNESPKQWISYVRCDETTPYWSGWTTLLDSTSAQSIGGTKTFGYRSLYLTNSGGVNILPMPVPSSLTSTSKTYLVAVSELNSSYSQANSNCYMENGVLYSDSTQVATTAMAYTRFYKSLSSLVTGEITTAEFIEAFLNTSEEYKKIIIYCNGTNETNRITDLPYSYGIITGEVSRYGRSLIQLNTNSGVLYTLKYTTTGSWGSYVVSTCEWEQSAKISDIPTVSTAYDTSTTGTYSQTYTNTAVGRVFTSLTALDGTLSGEVSTDDICTALNTFGVKARLTAQISTDTTLTDNPLSTSLLLLDILRIDSYGFRCILTSRNSTAEMAVANWRIDSGFSGWSTLMDLDNAQSITGTKSYDCDALKVSVTTSNNDYRNALGTAGSYLTSGKRYLAGLTGIGGRYTSIAENVYMEDSVLYSNSEQVATISDVPTLSSSYSTSTTNGLTASQVNAQSFTVCYKSVSSIDSSFTLETSLADIFSAMSSYSIAIYSVYSPYVGTSAVYPKFGTVTLTKFGSTRAYGTLHSGSGSDSENFYILSAYPSTSWTSSWRQVGVIKEGDVAASIDSASTTEALSEYQVLDAIEENRSDLVDISSAQTITGAKMFNYGTKISINSSNTDYRYPLTTPGVTSSDKRYILGTVSTTGSLYSNTNASCYMQSGLLYSNSSQVVTVSDTFVGTQSEWDALSTTEQSAYLTAEIYES